MHYSRQLTLLLLAISQLLFGASTVLGQDQDSSQSQNTALNKSDSGSGICSWYGAEGEIQPGWPTGCGEGFNRLSMSVAHRKLPCGTEIQVTNETNGRSVVVRVNDRGPFDGRILDLTYAAFGEIEDRDKGIFYCSFKVL